MAANERNSVLIHTHGLRTPTRRSRSAGGQGYGCLQTTSGFAASKTRWDLACPTPPRFTMRPKTSFGAQIPEASPLALPRKKTTSDRNIWRKHVRNWTSRMVRNWFKDALERRDCLDYMQNVPNPCPDGNGLLKITRKAMGETICGGDSETGMKLWDELRCRIEEYKATCGYNDLQHCYEFAYYLAPRFSVGQRLPLNIGFTETPAPGHYRVPVAIGCGPTMRGPHPQIKQVGRAVFPRGPRGFCPDKNPGPGAYFTEVSKDPSLPWCPKYTLTGRGDTQPKRGY